MKITKMDIIGIGAVAAGISIVRFKSYYSGIGVATGLVAQEEGVKWSEIQDDLINDVKAAKPIEKIRKIIAYKSMKKVMEK